MEARPTPPDHKALEHSVLERRERDGTGGFRFFRPDGPEVTAAGTAPPLPTDPVAALRARHRTAGITIDAQTGSTRWDGRPADCEHAVFCLVGQEELRSP